MSRNVLTSLFVLPAIVVISFSSFAADAVKTTASNADVKVEANATSAKAETKAVKHHKKADKKAEEKKEETKK